MGGWRTRSTRETWSRDSAFDPGAPTSPARAELYALLSIPRPLRALQVRLGRIGAPLPAGGGWRGGRADDRDAWRGAGGTGSARAVPPADSAYVESVRPDLLGLGLGMHPSRQVAEGGSPRAGAPLAADRGAGRHSAQSDHPNAVWSPRERCLEGRGARRAYQAVGVRRLTAMEAVPGTCGGGRDDRGPRIGGPKRRITDFRLTRAAAGG